MTPKISSRIKTWSVAAVRRSPASASGRRPHKAAKTSGVSTLLRNLGPSRGGGSHSARAFLAPLDYPYLALTSLHISKRPVLPQTFLDVVQARLHSQQNAGRPPSTKLPSFKVSSPQSSSSSAWQRLAPARRRGPTKRTRPTTPTPPLRRGPSPASRCNVACTKPDCQVS